MKKFVVEIKVKLPEDTTKKAVREVVERALAAAAIEGRVRKVDLD